MKTYSISYNKSRKSWTVSSSGLFSAGRSFPTMKDAIEYTKKTAGQERNRPSKVKLYNFNGSHIGGWEYKKYKPKKRSYYS